MVSTSIFSTEVKTMFKGSQTDRSSDQTIVGNIDIYPVLKAEELLADEKRKAWVEELPQLTGVSHVKYQLYYQPVLTNFAGFVQNLPETKQGGFYSHEGAVLDHGLERAVRAMQLFHGYLHSASESEKSEEQKALWNYAVFTAALLFDVGKLFTKLLVTLRQKTKKIRIWNPFEGSMLKFATHYSYDFGEENWDELRRQVTLITAQSLMPPLGFAWLSSDKDVLTAWCSLLRENFGQVGAYLSAIPLADAQLFDHYFEKYKKELAEKSKIDKLAIFKDSLLVTKATEISKTPFAQASGLFSRGSEAMFAPKGAEAAQRTMSLAAGEAFLQWLKHNIADGNISINLPNSGVHVTSEGVLLLAKIFQDFVKENPIYRDWQAVREQFQQLEITRQSSEQVFRQYVDKEFKVLNDVTVVVNIYAIFLYNQNMPAVNPNIVAVNPTQEALPRPQAEIPQAPPSPQSNLPYK